MKKNWQFWLLAFLITLLAAVYQKMSGPTYPVKVKIKINETNYKLSLLTSSHDTTDVRIELKLPDNSITGNLFFHRYKIDEPYKKDSFIREGNKLVAILPHQPMAGKLQYYIELASGNQMIEIAKDKPIVIRFKAGVPIYVMIPHIFFIFFAMWLSNIAGLMAAFKFDKFVQYTKLTFIFLIVGGMILGPIVQHYAFGEYWTGIPFGWDLTDNKTLIAFVAWLLAFIFSFKSKKPYLTIIASLVTIIIFSIPHSMFGSELNYSTGHVMTGK
jgi:hypothetical protein